MDPVVIQIIDRLQWPTWLVAIALSVWLTVRAVAWVQVMRAPGTNGSQAALKVHRAELAGAWRERMEGLAMRQQKLMEQLTDEFRRSNQVQGELLTWMRRHQKDATARGELIEETGRAVKQIKSYIGSRDQ